MASYNSKYFSLRKVTKPYLVAAPTLFQIDASVKKYLIRNNWVSRIILEIVHIETFHAHIQVGTPKTRSTYLRRVGWIIESRRHYSIDRRNLNEICQVDWQQLEQHRLSHSRFDLLKSAISCLKNNVFSLRKWTYFFSSRGSAHATRGYKRKVKVSHSARKLALIGWKMR